jgi:hypothetical protein
MSTETTDQGATPDTLAVAALLAEYQGARGKYANDALVQAMAAQLAQLAGLSDEQAAELAYPAPENDAVQTAPADVASAMGSYLRVCSSGGMPREDRDTVAAAVGNAQELGYFDLLKAPACLDRYDRERLLQAGRVLRWILDVAGEPVDEDLLSEARAAVAAIKRVLRLDESQSGAYGLAAADMPAAANGTTARGALLMGWRNAAVAWDVCASIHRSYGKGRDALFTTRQQDYLRHAADARAKFLAIPDVSTPSA